MASYSGQDVVIQAGASAIGELKNSNFTITADDLDTTTFGATGRNKTRTVSLREATLDFSGFLDPDDVGQAALMTALFAASAIGEIAALTLHPFGIAESTNLTGAWIVTSGNINASYDGMVEVNFSLKSDGAITYTP